MKKFCCVACVALLMLVVCIPCFAESTTSAEPIDWFGGETTGVIYYEYSATSGSMVDVQLPYRESNVGTVASPFSVGSWDFVVGDTISVSVASGGYTHLWKNDTDLGTISNNNSLYPFTIKISESSYIIRGGSTKNGTPVEGTIGSDGLIDSGVNAAISYLGSVLTYIWTTPSIMICIGLAVGVVLIGWGISKVKDLVVGY